MSKKISVRFILFFIASLFGQKSFALTVNDLSGYYKNGQLFFTWTNVANSTGLYHLYRSASPIQFGYQLASCSDLGTVHFNSSLNERRTELEGSAKYLSIDSGVTALTSQTGLFVATSEQNGSFYYALTVIENGSEDTSIIVGNNSLSIPIAEIISIPQAYFQGVKTIHGVAVELYVQFATKSNSGLLAPMINVGCLPFNFAVDRNGSGSNKPVIFSLHGGGGSFLDIITDTIANEMHIALDDWLPNGNATGWFGYNFFYDIYSHTAAPPTNGINFNYTQRRIKWAMDWAIHSLPIDSHRIVLDGVSMGALGAFNFSILYPDQIAATHVLVPCFNVAFLNDYNPLCGLNSSNSARLGIDSMLGTVATNLQCNVGVPTYDARDGGNVMKYFPNRDYPIVFATNGKNDERVGWTEKISFYDSVNKFHFGGYFFWDLREHDGTGRFWKDDFDLLRYRNNESYPAFNNCSIDGDPGIGDNVTGDTTGSINGFLDWSSPQIDTATEWKINLFMHHLRGNNNIIINPPDSCFADVTPKRLQKFSIPSGTTIYWKTGHNGQVVQFDSIIYQSGLITIPSVKIFRDTTTLIVYYGSMYPLSVVSPSNQFLKITPNPSSGIFNVHFSPEMKGTNELVVTNIFGDVVWRKNISDVFDLRVDLQHQPKGVYLIHVSGNELQFAEKLVIE